MTRRCILRARLRARVSDERGFTLLETIIAVTVMFGSLLALAYTATIGFGYQSLSRQRQTANGLANQVMEEIRGLAYTKITAGMLSTDLTGDGNIVLCNSGTTYRFLSCTASASVPGQGEKIVSTTGLGTTVPLVPHRSSTAPNTNPVIDGTTYQWSTYVTRDDSVTSAPYRVTVLVTWTGGAKANATNKLVRVQSLFWSPTGCRNSDTHPFAAPCQPFFFATTDVPQATVDIAGSVDQVGVVDGSLYGPVASSSVQQEQVSQSQASWQASEVELTAQSSTTFAGGTTKATIADTDPATTTGTYSRWRCPTDVACTTGSVSSTNSGNTVTLTAGSTTAEADSTTAASATNVCPPPTATGETDSLLCSGTRVQQTGNLTAAIDIQHSSTLGAATIARVLAAESATTSVVQRNIHPNSNGCSPTSTTDGCVGMSVNRTIGTINIGGLPATFSPGAGWAGANPWNGYFLSVVGYTDSLAASVGTSSPIPAATQAGTIYYYNGTGYSSLAVTAAGVNGLNASYTTMQNVGGTAYTLTISTDTTAMTAASTSLSPTTPGGNQTRTAVTSRVIPPAVKVRYQLTGGSNAVDLTATVLLGTLEANGAYAPAPAAGT